MKRIISAALALALTLSLSSCGKGADYKSQLTNPELSYSQEELDALKSEKHYSYEYDVPAFYKYFEGRLQIGNIVSSGNFKNPEDPVTKSLMKNYNIYTMENEFKPSSINPSEGEYRFEACDAFIEFGRDTNAKLRGHTLLWHTQVPDWWFKADPKDTRSLKDCDAAGALATSEVLQERMKEYITTVVTRYKGEIDYWDVCNEVLTHDSIRRKEDNSYWADIIGDLNGDGYYDDYVELAFQTARSCDEDAVLMMNDFNMEWQDSKTQAMYDMVERFMRNGTRIDGVGFQCHISVNVDHEALRRNLETIAGLSKVYDECFPDHKGEFVIQITELDMNMFVDQYRDKQFVRWTDEDHKRQADAYAGLMEIFLEFADRGVLDAVVFWTADDSHSWINVNPMRNGLPSIYDSESRLKECYYAMVETSFK